MQTVLVAILVLSFIASALSSCSSTQIGNCVTCNDFDGASCGGVTYTDGHNYSCVQPSAGSFNTSDNPCNLNTNNYYCIAGATNLTSPFSGFGGYTYYQTYQAYNTCINNPNANSQCCSLSVSCPVTCTSEPTNQLSNPYLAPFGSNKICYDACTDCNGGAASTTYCNNNCDSNGSGTFACPGGPNVSTCCDLNSATYLFSWLSYLM